MERITINKVDFSEIFHYAEKKFGVGWNECCDLFHRNEVLRYQKTDEIDLLELAGYIDSEGEDERSSEEMVKDFTEDQIRAMSNDDTKKAYLILARFMLDNNVEDMVVDND